MTSFRLPRPEWPALPEPHAAFLERALETLAGDARIVGVAAGGSFCSDDLDECSDLDLVLVTEPEAHAALVADGPALAARLGPLLVAFRGDHVGELRLWICAAPDRASHLAALRAAIALYRELREALDAGRPRRSEAERAAVAYVDAFARRSSASRP